jgi:hypothetical protein
MTCSFSSSPVPTPKEKRRSSNIDATVAAACATFTGWMRNVGQVTPTPTSMSSVACATPPSVLQTNGDSPWASSHGWKWSEMLRKSNPVASAREANCTSSFGPNSSLESV